MNSFRTLIIIILTFLIQTVLIPYVKIFGVAPDLLLVVVAVSALVFGIKQGVAVGLVCGLLQDVFSSTVYVHTLSKVIIGLLIGFIKENVLGEEEAVSAVTVFMVSVVSALIDLSLLFFFLGRPVATLYYLVITVIIFSIYNVVFVPVIYPLMKRFASEA